jgi:hypothetical protein
MLQSAITWICSKRARRRRFGTRCLLLDHRSESCLPPPWGVKTGGPPGAHIENNAWSSNNKFFLQTWLSAAHLHADVPDCRRWRTTHGMERMGPFYFTTHSQSVVCRNTMDYGMKVAVLDEISQPQMHSQQGHDLYLGVLCSRVVELQIGVREAQRKQPSF